MAQILTWDVDYTPPEQPWSVVRCESRKTIEDYLTTGSIILLSPGRFYEHKLFFLLARLRLPLVAIAVVSSNADVPEIIDHIDESGIEDYIRSKMIRKLSVDQPRQEIAIAESYLTRGNHEDHVDLLIVFDMDGTIVRSDGFTYAAMKRGFEIIYREEGIDRTIPTYEDLIPQLGLGKGSIYQQFLPESSHHRCDELRTMVRQNIRQRLIDGEGEFFPTVETTLYKLINLGAMLVLASSSPYDYFYPVVEKFQLSRFFQSVLCLGERPGQTKAHMIREMQERYHPANTVMVGDRYVDIDAGKECGCFTVGCAYGFGLPDEMEGADAVIDSFDQLLDKVAFLTKNIRSRS